MQTKNEVDSLVASLTLKALEQLPEKRLVYGVDRVGHDCDVVGAFAKLMSPNDGRFMYEFLSDKTGLPGADAETQLRFLIAINDDLGYGEQPEARYQRVHKYLEDVVNGV